MVGRRPRQYTLVSQLKLASTIYQRILATRPDVNPEVASDIATKASEKNAMKMETASRIYHEIKNIILHEQRLPTQKLGAVRVLIQKVLMQIWRVYEAKNEPLTEDEVRPIVTSAYVTAIKILGLPETVAKAVIIAVLNRCPTMVPREVAEAMYDYIVTL